MVVHWSACILHVVIYQLSELSLAAIMRYVGTRYCFLEVEEPQLKCGKLLHLEQVQLVNNLWFYYWWLVVAGPVLSLLKEQYLHEMTEKQKRKLQKKTPLVPTPPECRVMSLTTFPLLFANNLITPSWINATFCIIAGCSDSIIRYRMKCTHYSSSCGTTLQGVYLLWWQKNSASWWSEGSPSMCTFC